MSLQNFAESVCIERSEAAVNPSGAANLSVDAMSQEEREFYFSITAVACFDILAASHLVQIPVTHSVLEMVTSDWVTLLRWATPSSKAIFDSLKSYYQYLLRSEPIQICIPDEEVDTELKKLLVAAAFLRLAAHPGLESNRETIFKLVGIVKNLTSSLIPEKSSSGCEKFSQCLALWLNGLAHLIQGRKIEEKVGVHKDVKLLVIETAKSKLIEGLSAFEHVRQTQGTANVITIPASVDIMLSFSPFLIACACALRQELYECHYWLVKAAEDGKYPPPAVFDAATDMNHVRHLTWITDAGSMSRNEARRQLKNLSLSGAREADKASAASLMPPPAPVAQIPIQVPVDVQPNAPALPAPLPPQEFPSVMQAAAAHPPSVWVPMSPPPNAHPMDPMGASVAWLTKSTLDFLGDAAGHLGLSVNLNNQMIEERAALERNEAAKRRLHQRLELFQMRETREIPGDGNCLMYSLSDQLFGKLTEHRMIRLDIVKWLRNNADLVLPNGAKLSEFVHGMSWDQYCDGMQKDGTWGDHLTLVAAAELYGVRIMIISSTTDESSFITEIVPTKQHIARTIFLNHYAEYHYGSILPIHQQN